MKKISQAIIAATLILDVAVIFTFGLAVISSFEDGSRLPETTFVRRPIEGRVAGVTISTCPTTANVFIETPIAGSVIAAETFGISAMAGSSVPSSALMNFVYPITVSPFYKRIPAVYQPYTMPNGATYNKWIADVNVMVEQISKGFFTFKAEGYDSIGNCIARSDSRSISINFTSSNTLPAPAVNITAPLPGSVLSGTQAAVIGEISNLPSGTQIQEALINIFNNATQVAGPFSAPAPNTANPFARQSKFDSTTIANGAYDVKMFVHYLDSNSVLKFIESAPISVNIDNASTASTNTSNNQNANSGANINIGTNYNSNTSNTNTSTANANTSTSTSGTNTNSTTSTNTSTGTSGSTITQPTIAISFPRDQDILRRNEGVKIKATSSVKLSACSILILKVGEQWPQVKTTQAQNTTDKPVLDPTGTICEYNWDLRLFSDGDYKITTEGWQMNTKILSPTISTTIQKFSLKWLAPNNNDKLSGLINLKAEINGIYEKDNKTPMKDIIIEFWQIGEKDPYPKYNGRAQQKLGTHEWLYEWKTDNSLNGRYMLEVRITNSATATNQSGLYNTDKLFVEVLNQISSASLSDSSNINVNQNTSTPAPSVTNSNLSNTNKAINSAAGSLVNYNQNSNSSGVNTGLNGVLVVTSTDQIDSDNDGLSDEKEAQLGTNPNSNDSDGDGYKDGEEVYSGHDPLKSSSDSVAATPPKPKPIEEPKNIEKPVSQELIINKEVENKEVKIIPQPPTTVINGGEPIPEVSENVVILRGKGPANTILTLFIYSDDPIVVTVRTNENGEWIYELDKTLEDGEHEVYATITDDTGKIESTSSPMRFLVKQAVAETMPERADTGANSIPGSSSTNLYLLISGIMVFVAIVVGFIIALKRKRGDTNQIT